MLTVGGAKMAKSEGNFITVRDSAAPRLRAKSSASRLLGTHYRDPLDWTADRLRQARQTLDRFYRALLSKPAARPSVSATSAEASVGRRSARRLGTT